MAVGNRFDVGLPGRAQIANAHEEALRIVEEVIAGKRRELPLEQPLICEAVVYLLRELPRLRADAHKLAILKEVFGGK